MSLEIIGGLQSNYVRVVRMACEEKGVPYTLVLEAPRSARAIPPLMPRGHPGSSTAGSPTFEGRGRAALKKSLALGLSCIAGIAFRTGTLCPSHSTY
jgi:glutathione S-transferase